MGDFESSNEYHDDHNDIALEMPILDIGMDSMSLSQFKGMLMTDYGLNMTDEEMFDEGIYMCVCVCKQALYTQLHYALSIH